ncbi:MAG: hypothetical protein ACI4P4_10900 [Faecousia sp.]
MKDFIMAALPWVLAGFFVAGAAASKIKKMNKEKKTAAEEPRQVDERQKEADNYGLLGMCIGMCFGLLLDNLGVFSGFGMCIGMALGLMIGTCIKKDGDE